MKMNAKRTMKSSGSGRSTDKEALVEKVLSAPGFGKMLGMHALSVQEGSVTLAIDRRDDLLQSNGFFHGGVITALADNAGGAAVTTALPKNYFVVTIGLNVTFLGPCSGDRVVAEANCIKPGKTVCTAYIEIYSEEDQQRKLCATATIVYRSVPTPKSFQAE